MAMGALDWEHRVLLFSICCHFVLLWRLWSQRLAGVYPFLTVFLASEAVQNIILLPIPRRSNIYGWIFFLSTPVLWILAYLVVLELYRLILEDYAGIAGVGRRAVSWCMGLAVVASIFYAIPDLRLAKGPSFSAIRVYVIMERSTVLALLLFLILIQLFLFRYGLQLSRNRMVYATGYSIYFGIGIAQDIVWTSLGIRTPDAVTLSTVATAGILLLIGAALLNQKGEVRVELKPVDEDSDRARLHQQLVEMNRMLSRAARGRG
jgi:hypothetical protein